MPKSDLPSAPGSVAKEYPDVWKTYADLGKASAESGPLDVRERRLIKLGIAIAAGSEGAVHSHTRRALDEGISIEEIKHAALLAITTIGFPAAIAAFSWITDITDPASKNA